MSLPSQASVGRSSPLETFHAISCWTLCALRLGWLSGYIPLHWNMVLRIGSSSCCRAWCPAVVVPIKAPLLYRTLVEQDRPRCSPCFQRFTKIHTLPRFLGVCRGLPAGPPAAGFPPPGKLSPVKEIWVDRRRGLCCRQTGEHTFPRQHWWS